MRTHESLKLLTAIFLLQFNHLYFTNVIPTHLLWFLSSIYHENPFKVSEHNHTPNATFPVFEQIQGL